jgi:hypothetical protein
MDVGFNNTNKLHLVLGDKYLEDVVWLVEANSNETHELWATWSDQSLTNHNPLALSDGESSALIQKAYLQMGADDAEKIKLLVEVNKKAYRSSGERKTWKQIPISSSFGILDLECAPTNGIGQKETLQVRIHFRYFIVDGHKIAFYYSDAVLSHKFYIDAFLRTYFQRTHDNYSRWNHTDAQNFHNCINYLESLDKDPRETVYKPEGYMEQYFIFEPIKFEPIK